MGTVYRVAFGKTRSRSNSAIHKAKGFTVSWFAWSGGRNEVLTEVT